MNTITNLLSRINELLDMVSTFIGMGSDLTTAGRRHTQLIDKRSEFYVKRETAELEESLEIYKAGSEARKLKAQTALDKAKKPKK
jgi:hypothetical protein